MLPNPCGLSCPCARSRKRSVDKRLTPDESERCLMQTQANESIGHDISERLLGLERPSCARLVAAASALLETTEPLRHPAAPEYDDLLTRPGRLGAPRMRRLGDGDRCRRGGGDESSGRLRATAWVGCPRSLRRLLLAGLGVALVRSPGRSSPAGDGVRRQRPRHSRCRRDPSERSMPTRRQRWSSHPGDTLWQLAADRLRSSASPGEVAALVHDLHHRNRGVIGPDPDLIRPGQRLAVPARTHRS